MARESFADETTAEVLNANFVCIKVDREERPDLDAVYLSATVAMTGQAGWPMTCFLTPEGEPFYCGTYYPKMARAGIPSFVQVLNAITETWRFRRSDVQQAAHSTVAALREQTAGLPDSDLTLSAGLLDRAVAAVLGDEDPFYGGFGGAPKFPPSALLEGLLRSFERTGDPAVLDVVSHTADAMARGGIYDQLRGGFSRYSVDAQWIVPHFEKMLYDNAALLRCYGHLARRTSMPLARRIAEETAEFLLTDLGNDVGGFASGLDADTQGIEGATYVWRPGELVGQLGPDDGAWASEVFAVTTAGTFDHGTSVLRLPHDPDDVARLARVRSALRAIRDQRPQPARDDKVITAWNGMAIVALAEVGAAFEHPEWIGAAQRCAEYLLATHVVCDGLRRSSLGGMAGTADAVLEDYAWLSSGLLALYQATGVTRWLHEAVALLDQAVGRFADDTVPGSWFDAARGARPLVARPRDPFDGATPAGASALAEALLTASVLAETDAAVEYARAAYATLDRAAVVLASAPRSAGHWLAVGEAAIRGPIHVAVVGDGADPRRAALLRTARDEAPGGAAIRAGAVDHVPLPAHRAVPAGVAAAYVCRGTVCDLPVTGTEELAAALRAR